MLNLIEFNLKKVEYLVVVTLENNCTFLYNFIGVPGNKCHCLNEVDFTFGKGFITYFIKTGQMSGNVKY